MGRVSRFVNEVFYLIFIVLLLLSIAYALVFCYIGDYVRGVVGVISMIFCIQTLRHGFKV